jgi:carbonic anhydrase
MSLFASESSWGGNCSSPNQSPIDLNQSIAKKCDLLCDLEIDEAYVSSGTVAISDEGLVLSGNLGSCKFKGQGYTCAALLVNHPSHHTINNVAGDGEVIAFFTTPTGENLAVSALFRVNPANSHASQFLHQFVSYANATGPSQVTLNDWSLKNMIPSDASYYV